MGPSDLQSLLQEFLDACEASLDTIPVFEPGLGGAPARSFISPGQPTYDCACFDSQDDAGQLTVHCLGVDSDPIEPLKNHQRLNIVRLQATILRCVPAMSEDGGPYDPDDAQAAAEQVNADGWALWNHIFNLISAEQLFTLCSKIIWDGLRSITPAGGCGGYTLNLRVEFGGYDEVIGT